MIFLFSVIVSPEIVVGEGWNEEWGGGEGRWRGEVERGGGDRERRRGIEGERGRSKEREREGEREIKSEGWRETRREGERETYRGRGRERESD